MLVSLPIPAFVAKRDAFMKVSDYIFSFPFARLKTYFREARDEIVEANLSYLRFASTATLVLLILNLFLASRLIRNWTPSVYHIAFLPAMLVFSIVTWLLKNKRGLSSRAIMVLTVVFEVVLYGFVIAIDTIGSPDAPSIFVQLVCVALPAVFILPPWISYGLVGCAELACFIMTHFKNPFIAQYDVFQLFVGLLFSICVSQLVMSYRLDTYDMRAKYEGLSVRDTLSNLYNKRAFYEKAHAYLERTNPSSTCAIAFIDLDDFKAVNDTLGHRAGDEILIGMGNILSELFRPNDIICRFGGDEFLILLDGLVDERIIRRRFSLVLDRFAMKSRELAGRKLTCSVGVVCAENIDVKLDNMVAMADIALYEAKHAGKNNIVITWTTSLSN
ncbi:hypothetical protein B5F74_00545 [Collinsella sp. An271]|nr:hypothetical protein B5F74_00545 [Collinsella sp. An271]